MVEQLGLHGTKIELAAVTDISIPGSDADLPARIYRPDSDAMKATILYLHGGGHTLGNLETPDGLCRQLSRDTNSVVVSLAYRLAPENPFPAAVEDSLTAALWTLDNIALLGGNPRSFCLAGDSSGANLAAVTTMQLRERGIGIAAQLLMYPETDFERDKYPSRQEFAHGYLLDREDLDWFSDNYLPTGVERTQPLVSPICGDLSNLPPTLVVTAEFDPLRDEGEQFARALLAAGNQVTLIRFPGLVHAFAGLSTISPRSAAAVAETFARFAVMIAR